MASLGGSAPGVVDGILSTSDQTKHIDVLSCLICICLEDGMVKIQFIKSTENNVGLFTKNVAVGIYEKDVEKMVWLKSVVVGQLQTGMVLER